jgi:hypothetical protein
VRVAGEPLLEHGRVRDRDPRRFAAPQVGRRIPETT